MKQNNQTLTGYFSLVIVTSLVLAGCASRESQVVGRWSTEADDFALEFFDGGTMLMTSDGRNFAGTYEYSNDDQISLTVSGDFGPTTILLTEVTVENDRMTFHLNGEDRTITLTRLSSKTEPTQIVKATVAVAPTKAKNAAQFMWTAKTGELRLVGAAADGTIYGINNTVYAVISSQGQLIQTTQLDLSSCVRWTGGAGAYGVSDWFVVQPNGTIISFQSTAEVGPCAIVPGASPTIKKYSYRSTIFSYTGTDAPVALPSLPNGFKYLDTLDTFHKWAIDDRNIFWLDGRRAQNEFVINPVSNMIAFVNHEGKFNIFTAPDKIEKMIKGRVAFLVTPWDHVYMSYNLLDGLGNLIESKVMKVKVEGKKSTTDQIDKLPDLLSQKPVTYLPETGHIYFIQGSQLIRYDTDFNQLATFALPTDLNLSGNESVFVGHDQAFYVFNQTSQTLSKYKLVDSSGKSP